MKVLNAGDLPLSNADVLDWIRRKRAQHASEDAADHAKGLAPPPRPSNFLTALTRHEGELSSDRYPYAGNPSAYAGPARSTQFEKFALEAETVVQDALEAEWAGRLPHMSADQVEREFAPLQEMKCLTEPEMLMIYNHAPVCVEMLTPMIENVEDRFSDEELRLLVKVVLRTLRVDENGKKEGS